MIHGKICREFLRAQLKEILVCPLSRPHKITIPSLTMIAYEAEDCTELSGALSCSV